MSGAALCPAPGGGSARGFVAGRCRRARAGWMGLGRWAVVCAILAWCLAASAWAAAPSAPGADTAASPAPGAIVAVPDWRAPVMDLAGVLDADQLRHLDTQLRDWEKTQGSQLFVLLVPTTGPETIEQYARRVFDTWAVGRRGLDDGVLLLVAVQDRRVRIEVGYGLEGAVTDVQSGRIIREQIAPQFAQGEVYAGLQAGVSALQALIRGEDLPAPDQTDDEGAPELVMAGFLLVMALVMPLWLSAALAGGFVWLLTGSLGWAVLGALAGVLVGAIARLLGITKRLRRRGAGGRDDDFGGGFGGGGFGGGSGGSGGGGGGGGRGGGGGASGSW
ncbi:TPM domain-containing protein [Castellaniella hirudinis]|uniref:TPM domain-containing protein n=1 Tax=Castellaniella hirudinis TaxID=1144617 RepID=UPI0039C16F0A